MRAGSPLRSCAALSAMATFTAIGDRAAGPEAAAPAPAPARVRGESKARLSRRWEAVVRRDAVEAHARRTSVREVAAEVVAQGARRGTVPWHRIHAPWRACRAAGT